jgi:hypothetical protein
MRNDRSQNKNFMKHEYAHFYCRVCGELVFVPLPEKPNGQSANGRLGELTCSRGHTDAYDFSELEQPQPKPAESSKVRRAMAGIG